MNKRRSIGSFSGLLAVLVSLVLAPSGVSAQSVLEDPTRPSDWQKATVEEGVQSVERSASLDSILYSPRRRVAVINGHTMSEGESREGLTLLKVDERRVVVRAKGEIKELLLKPVSNVRR